MTLAALGSFGLQVGVVYLPFGQMLFETVTLPAVAWLPIFVAVALGAMAVAATDRLSRRG